MARSRINEITDDLITDSGSVLWSFVKGEQLEFPITMNFIEDVTVGQSIDGSGVVTWPNGYTFEARVIEANNVSGQEEAPSTVKTGGVSTLINVRRPINKGTWQAAVAYNKEDVVLYNAKYYKLLSGAARINATAPSSDSMWQETLINRIYLQFEKTLSSTWAVSPGVGSPVYGFFELRVKEPTDNIFQRTWKPIRGLVEILFSPTYSADD